MRVRAAGVPNYIKSCYGNPLAQMCASNPASVQVQCTNPAYPWACMVNPFLTTTNATAATNANCPLDGFIGPGYAQGYLWTNPVQLIWKRTPCNTWNGTTNQLGVPYNGALTVQPNAGGLALQTPYGSFYAGTPQNPCSMSSTSYGCGLPTGLNPQVTVPNSAVFGGTAPVTSTEAWEAPAFPIAPPTPSPNPPNPPPAKSAAGGRRKLVDSSHRSVAMAAATDGGRGRA